MSLRKVYWICSDPLAGDLDITLPFSSDDRDDAEYLPKNGSTKELIDYWESQKQLNQFWEVWRQDYLLTLHKTLPLFHEVKLLDNQNSGK